MKKNLLAYKESMELMSQKRLYAWLSLSAFVLRIVYISFFGDPMSGPDADTYSSVAERVLVHGPFTSAQQIPYWPIGYPWFVALVLSISGGSYLLLSVAQILIFSLALYCYCCLLSEFLSKKICILSGVLFGLNPAIIVASTQLMYEIPQISLIIIGFWTLRKSLYYRSQKIIYYLMGFLALLLLVFASVMQLKVTPIFLVALYLIVKSKKIFHATGNGLASLVSLVLFFSLVLPPLVISLRNVQAGDGLGVSKNYQVHVGFGLSEAGIKSNCVNPSTNGYDDPRYIACLQIQKLKSPQKGLFSVTKQFFDLATPYIGVIKWLENGNGTWYHGIDFRRTIRMLGETFWSQIWKPIDFILSGLWMSSLLFLVTLGINFSYADKNLQSTLGFQFLRYSLLSLVLVSVLGDGDSRHRLTMIPLYLPFIILALLRIRRDFRKNSEF